MNPVCPACGVGMRLVRWRDLEGFECPACHGHFIRAKHLEHYLEKHGPDRVGAFALHVGAAPPSSRPLTCPACGTRSFREVRRGIVVMDVCGSCSSVYFDAGEAATYLRHTQVRKFGADIMDDIVSTDTDWSDLLDSFVRDFFD